MNFEMMQRFQYSLEDLEYMIPWEREIYVGLLEQHIKDENERQKQQMDSMKR